MKEWAFANPVCFTVLAVVGVFAALVLFVLLCVDIKISGGFGRKP